MYRPKQYYSEAVAILPTLPEIDPIHVYFRDKDGKLGRIDAGSVVDHEDAILYVKEALVDSAEGWTAPVLAVINGRKE